MFQANLLEGKTVLITGAGSGLGAAMAARFAGLGASLALVGRRIEALEDTAQPLRQRGTHVEIRACDIRQPGEVERGLGELWEACQPNVLVNNAAANFLAQSETLSARAADAILSTTLHGALYCTLEMGRHWIAANQRGTILSILSTSVLTGRAFSLPSAMAKSGLLALTRSLAVEWGPKGVRTVAIAPGPFPTPGATRQLNPAVRSSDSGSAPRNPLGRTGEPDELTDLASYLISDRAAYINGEMIVIDGGAHLRSSGAEDLLQWGTEQWEALRAAGKMRPPPSPRP